MKYLIEKSQNRVMSYLMGDDGRAVEIHADQEADGLKLGDICIGRVQRVAESTGACFVDLAPGISGYLPFEDIVAPTFTRKGVSPKLQQGDELVVQISRESFGTKGMSLTTKLQLGGRYVLLEKCASEVGISRKIPEERRQQLRERFSSPDVLGEMRKTLGKCGIIIRTNAEYASEEDILKELSRLSASMQHILLTAPYRPAFTVLFRQPPRWLKRTDALSAEKIDAVLTDDRSIFDLLSSYLSPPMAERLRLYEDRMISMHNVFSLTRELSLALCRKVHMKSGANLVIEQTEALVAIDVNSAHAVSVKDKEKAALKVNLEAAKETARQIRLRGLSGMILVDFINMEENASYEELLGYLRTVTAPDPMRVDVIDRTALGLVEMTRRKVEVPLWQQLGSRASGG